jgi:GMP synthase (glutamine-hydrolysing)
MMKTLVVNCSLNIRAKIEELLRAVGDFSEFTAIHFKDIKTSYEVEDDIDTIVLSGSKARIIDPSERNMFRDIVNLINNLELPIFGICFGFQLISWSLGCRVKALDEPVVDRFEDVRVIEADEIFRGFETYRTIPFAQSHNDYVLKDSLDVSNLILLADSSSCEVEAVKHKSKPFYGVQFHPERTSIKNKTCPEGRMVIENFFKLVVKR